VPTFSVAVVLNERGGQHLERLTNKNLITACAELGIAGDIGDPELAMRHTLYTLAHRHLDYDDEIRTHTEHLEALTQRVAPQLLERFGVGFDTAAEMLVAAGDNNDRIGSEAAFAKLCGVCPIPTGSGRSSGRHRLNRGGNRQANAALYRVVIVRMRWHPPTVAYVERRTAEGLTKKDIIRCLKRFVAREIYHHLPEPHHPPQPPQYTELAA
jgi:transposase